jgi:hypothetical protein
MRNTIFLWCFCLLAFTSTSYAQRADSTISFRVLLKFQSECCGVPSDRPLVKSIQAFKKKYHLKSIQAYRMGPMGREGEYYLGFHLKELNKSLRWKLIGNIKAAVVKMSRDKGTVVLEENSDASLPSSIEIKATKF